MTYSLIIPHRGPAELLERLLKSVPKRDDMEVIVVEDIDARGAGWARNQGLRRAKGEYLIFADSDDYFMPCINEVLDQHHTADIVYFSATSIEEGSGKKSWRAARVNWVMAQEPEKREFLLRHTFTEPWCHIVRRKFIEKHRIRFDETPILNDVHFSTQAGYYAKSVNVIPLKAYCVCNHPGSVGKRRSPECLIAYTRVMAETNVFNRRHGIDRYHARMMRPFMQSLLKLRLKTARRCWLTMRKAGIPTSTLLEEVLIYPYHLLHWFQRRTKYAPYA